MRSSAPGAKDLSQVIYLRASSNLGCDVRHMAESLGHMHPGGASADYIATSQTMALFGFGRSPAGTGPCHIPQSHAWPLLLLSLHLPHQVLWHGQGSSCVYVLTRQRYSSPTQAAAACLMRSPAGKGGVVEKALRTPHMHQDCCQNRHAHCLGSCAS